MIEADAIKDSDVVLEELRKSSLFENDSSLSQFVHDYSTRRAQGALVAAVNAQRDVIFDGMESLCIQPQQLHLAATEWSAQRPSEASVAFVLHAVHHPFMIHFCI